MTELAGAKVDKVQVDEAADAGPGFEYPKPVAQPEFKARCPECTYRDGPFTSPAAAGDALMKHVEKKHAPLVLIVRGRPLPEGNELMARMAVKGLLDQRQRMDKILQDSRRIVGPDGQGIVQIDVPKELVEFIRSADVAMMHMLDLILEMRTGRPEINIQPRPKPDAAAEKKEIAAP